MFEWGNYIKYIHRSSSLVGSVLPSLPAISFHSLLLTKGGVSRHLSKTPPIAVSPFV